MKRLLSISTTGVLITLLTLLPQKHAEAQNLDTLYLDMECEITVPDMHDYVTWRDNCCEVSLEQTPEAGQVLRGQRDQLEVTAEGRDCDGNLLEAKFTFLVLDTIGPEGGAPPPAHETHAEYVIDKFFTLDLSDDPVGNYTRDLFEEDWPGVSWRDSENAQRMEDGESRFVFIDEFQGHKWLRVNYPAGNVGTYGGQTCSACGSQPERNPTGGGERFTYIIEELIPDPEGQIDIWMHGKVLVNEGFQPAKGGKIWGTMMIGEEHGAGATAPTRKEGASVILMWNANGEQERGSLSFYIYDQGLPGRYARSVKWEQYRGLQYIREGEEMDMTIRIRRNTLGANGKANSDGFVEAWINGEKVAYNDGIKFLHEDGFHALAHPWFYQAEMATFFGGCCISHKSRRDEVFRYRDWWIGDVDGVDIPEDDPVDPDVVLPWVR